MARVKSEQLGNIIRQGRNEGQGGTMRRVPILWGTPKFQQCRKYFPQYSMVAP